MPSDRLHGAFLVDKPEGPTSFQVVHRLKKALGAKKVGHGGTLDPFATGLLVVFVGNATRLAQYFLGSPKGYEGTFLFGKTTASGDLTTPVTETTETIPSSLEELQDRANLLTVQPYLQTPPMYSAKKVDGQPLYKLARKGIEIEREPKLCHLYRFEIISLDGPRAKFRLFCSRGTYVRTLAQDFAKICGSLGVLEVLKRTTCGNLGPGMPLEALEKEIQASADPSMLPNFIPFDQLLEGLPRLEATENEVQNLRQGKQGDLLRIIHRTPRESLKGWEHYRAIYCNGKLIAVAKAREDQMGWQLDRVFSSPSLRN